MSTPAARPCPACAGTLGNAFGVENSFDLVRCSQCQSIFTARLPGAEDAADYRSYYDAANLAVPSVVHRSLDTLVDCMASHRRTNRWLDVGFGAGALLAAGARQGWDMTGIEVSQHAAEVASSAGFDVHAGSVAEIDLPAASFDVVSAIEVIEHVPDPSAMLADARRLLRPEGVLYLTTPHARGLSARCLGLRWSVVSPPEHLQLFSISALRALCRRVGLRERSIKAHGVNPRELAGLLPRRRAAPKVSGGSRVATSYRANAALTRRRAGMIAKDVVNRALSGSRLGDSLKLEAQRPSDSSPTPAQT